MKSLKSVLVALLCCATVTGALAGAKKKADKDTDKFRYDIEYAKTGANNMLVVKTWSYSKKSNIATEQCKKNAVHGVIFKGYASGSGTVAQSALAKNANAYADHQQYFDAFFADGGPYMKYVSTADNSSREVRKVGKEYKVGVVVTVNKDQLRKDLEDAGIIKGLGSGF